MKEVILQTLPLVLAIVVPPVVAFFKSNLLAKVPSKWIPVLLPAVGAALAAAASFAGFDLAGFDAATADSSMWESVVTGILVGAASVGVHQVAVQSKKPS